jgi:hypothetical protein
MKISSTIITSLFCTSVAAVASADPISGPALGLRLGYSIPMGKVGKASADDTSSNLSDTAKYRIPIWIDAGYRISPAIYVGAFFQYGLIGVNKDKSSECNSGGYSCSSHDVQVGVNLHYHILPDAPFDPWIGLGMGYEWLTVSESGTLVAGGVSYAFDGSSTGKGLQFINLQAGGDYHVSPAFGLGPFISFSAGQYSSYSSTVTAAGVEQKQSGDVTDKGTHEWLTLGVRGQFNI